ncbi:MAG: hypothetical protein K2V38_03290 [Gemmataceae bacterium]|nr:hypothetical protein [Gemmataceae bacterium]
MNLRFGLIAASVVAMIGLTEAASVAARPPTFTITIEDVQYKAAAGGNPASAQPKGTYSVSQKGTYRVFIDYGTINNGVFTATPDVSKGGSSGNDINVVGNQNWIAAVRHDLKNPPANLYARARLQQLDAATGDWNNIEGVVAYKLCP